MLFWAVLAAAFIGPGTVTTAASSGASFGPALAWALVFSTLTCLVLQEAAARLTIATGHDLGEAIRRRSGRLVAAGVAVAVGIGCAAYEAGNILGGVAGARLLLDVDARWLTLGSAALAAALLWTGRTVWIARALGGLVAAMGVCFAWTALRIGAEWGPWLRASLVPSLPVGSETLALGLLGTTVVPYNLFLGSGLARGRELGLARFGLVLAILLGGAISLAVMVVGSALQGEFDFERLAALLEAELGGGAKLLFGLGLLGAGLSSAITAPLAAAICARSLSGGGEGWAGDGVRFRAVWGLVLACGVLFGVSGVKPVPVIVLAQALNGALLPLLVVFLLLAVNDRARMGSRHRNGALVNLVSAVCAFVCLVMGLRGVLGAAASILPVESPSPKALLVSAASIAAILCVPLGRAFVKGSS